MRILFGFLAASLFTITIVSILHPIGFTTGAQALNGGLAIFFMVLFVLSLRRG